MSFVGGGVGGGTDVHKFVEALQADFKTLSLETKKKYPQIKEVSTYVRVITTLLLLLCLLNLADVCISVAICHTMWQLWVEGDTNYGPGLVLHLRVGVCAFVHYAIMKLISGPARCGRVSREEIKLIFMTITLIELSMHSILSTLLQFHLSFRQARRQSPSYALLAAASKILFTTQSTRYSILWCRAVKQKT